MEVAAPPLEAALLRLVSKDCPLGTVPRRALRLYLEHPASATLPASSSAAEAVASLMEAREAIETALRSCTLSALLQALGLDMAATASVTPIPFHGWSPPAIAMARLGQRQWLPTPPRDRSVCLQAGLVCAAACLRPTLQPQLPQLLLLAERTVLCGHHLMAPATPRRYPMLKAMLV